ncbi:MAG TPA: peptidylprolyl isomerase [Candidatus Sumerlaeota bacterium]|nr:peptidylprolyl isomerase [Candidatus Sumerlaeota bacterium]
MALRKIGFALLFTLTAMRFVLAQEIPPLILEDEGKIQVAPRKKSDRQNNQNPAEPTPRPEDVVVAYADGRILSRAELDLRVTNEFERVKEEVQSRYGGVVATTGDGASGLDAPMAESEVLAEQQEQIDEAMRKEESLAVQNWVEHTMLAEEARRQGIVISESEFKTRLEEAQSASRLRDEQVENALNKLKLSRADYERGVYDALMIEQLLDRFIEINYTEEDFRKAYDQAPALYYTPEKFQIAHFSIALDGSESNSQLANLKRLAADVRDELRRGVDPNKVFAKDEFNRINQGIFGSISGYYSFQEGALPKIVEYHARKMKVGETSDVLQAARQEGKSIIPVSFHVVKILRSTPEEGKTFESARPAIRRAMLGIAKEQLLTIVRAAKSHEVITNMTGIPSTKLPGREELLRMQKDAQPVSLKFDRSKPLVDSKEVAAQKVEAEPAAKQTTKPRTNSTRAPKRKPTFNPNIDPALIPTPLPPVTPNAPTLQ